MYTTLFSLYLPYAILSWTVALLSRYLYLLLTGCRAWFTFNQYFVTFGPPAKREATIRARVSNSLFCVYVYAKYNQTNRARGTVLPPFPLITILPRVRKSTGGGGWEQQRCSSGSKSKASENYLQSICKPHIQIQMCACVCKQMKAASQLVAAEGRQLPGLTWLKLELCKYTRKTHTHVLKKCRNMSVKWRPSINFLQAPKILSTIWKELNCDTLLTNQINCIYYKSTYKVCTRMQT